MSEAKVEMAQEKEKVPAVEGVEKHDIAAELQQLGRQLAAASKAMLESPEAQELKSQLQRGLDSLGKAVNKIATQARGTDVAQKVEGRVSDAAGSLKERRVVETLADSVASALKTVNQSLEQVVEKTQKRTEKAKTKKSEPQQIEIVAEEVEE